MQTLFLEEVGTLQSVNGGLNVVFFYGWFLKLCDTIHFTKSLQANQRVPQNTVAADDVDNLLAASQEIMQSLSIVSGASYGANSVNGGGGLRVGVGASADNIVVPEPEKDPFDPEAVESLYINHYFANGSWQVTQPGRVMFTPNTGAQEQANSPLICWR